MFELIKNRYEFVLLFDVENGNPNGDPDAGNMPRMDAETGLGLVTDVCLKRKIRNYVQLVKKSTDTAGNFQIYVQEGSVLNTQHELAYKNSGIEPDRKTKKLPKDKKQAEVLTAFMCKHFYDIRTFGAVMTTEINCGQVRGPVQIAFARSIDPIVQQEITITRMAVTSEKDAEKKDREMGRKHIVPYALYRAEGFVSANLAEKVGFSYEDLELLWKALVNMFDHDRSAARGKMTTRKLIIFEHATALGNAAAQKLFDLVTVSRKDPARPPRAYGDYEVNINEAGVPQNVKLLVQ